MDDITLAEKIKRVIEDRQSLIQTTMMDGMLKDIEQYKSLQGELVSINLVEDTIREYYKDV